LSFDADKKKHREHREKTSIGGNVEKTSIGGILEDTSIAGKWGDMQWKYRVEYDIFVIEGEA
jgi:hypothetical protein